MVKDLKCCYEEISSRYIDGESPAKIAKDYEVPSSRIYRLLKRNHMTMRTLSEAWSKREKLPEKSILKRLYLVEGKSTEEIGDNYGVGASTVRRELKKYDIPTRSPREIMLKGKKLPSKSKLKELYIVKKRSVLDISKNYGVHRDTIEHLILEKGLPRRNKGNRALQRENFPTKFELENEYIIRGKSAEEISKKYRIGATTIRRELRRHKISIRSVSEAILKKSSNKKGLMVKINKQ